MDKSTQAKSQQGARWAGRWARVLGDLSKGLGARESKLYSETCTLSGFAGQGWKRNGRCGWRGGRQGPDPREFADRAEKLGNGAMQTDLCVS